jgi:hypothetical protein
MLAGVVMPPGCRSKLFARGLVLTVLLAVACIAWLGQKPAASQPSQPQPAATRPAPSKRDLSWDLKRKEAIQKSAEQHNGRPLQTRICEPASKTCETVWYWVVDGRKLHLREMADAQQKIFRRELCELSARDDKRECFDWDTGITRHHTKNEKGEWKLTALEPLSVGSSQPAAPSAATPRLATSLNEQNQTVIHFRGEIVKGDREAIVKIVRQARQAGREKFVLSLDLTGGNIEEARLIAGYAVAYQMPTMVVDDAACMDACLFIFSRGQGRYAGQRARLGVTGFGSMWRDALTSGRDKLLIADLKDEYGLPSAVFAAAVAAGPPDTLRLSAGDLMLAGVTLDVKETPAVRQEIKPRLVIADRKALDAMPPLPEAMWAAIPAKSEKLSQRRAESSDVIIDFHGTIARGDAEAVTRVYAEAHKAGARQVFLRLDLDSGELAEARALAALVRAGELTTIVPDGAVCMSSCMPLLTAGVRRYASEGTRIGLAGFYDSTKPQNAAQDDRLKSSLQFDLGIIPDIADRMFKARKGTTVWLTPDDLRALGVVVGSGAAKEPWQVPPPRPEPKVEATIWDEMPAHLRRVTRGPIIGSTGFIDLRGDFAVGDADVLRELSRTLRKDGATQLVLRLNAPDGDTEESHQLASVLMSERMWTAVPDMAKCLNACVSIFTAGRRKFASYSASIGLLGLSEMWKQYVDADSAARNKTAFMERFRLPAAVVHRMTITPGDKLVIINQVELGAMDVALGGRTLPQTAQTSATPQPPTPAPSKDPAWQQPPGGKSITSRTGQEDETIITFQGDMGAGDPDTVEAIVANSKKAGRGKFVLRLYSHGGERQVTRKLAEIVKTNEMTTVVPDKATCSTECIEVLAAGSRRLAAESAKIGMSGLAQLWEKLTAEGSNNAFRAILVRNFGLTAAVFERLIKTPDTVDVWFTPEELRAMGILVGGAAPPQTSQPKTPQQPQVASPTPKVDVRERIKVASYQGKVVITLKGEIVGGETVAFASAIAEANRAGKEVFGALLDSPGGLLSEGAQIAALVEYAKITTIVPEGAGCASACFVIFAAGNDKWADFTAQVGVHGASEQDGSDTTEARGATVLMARLVKEFGVPAAIIGRMVVTPPDQMVWLSPNELRSMGAVMKGAPRQLPPELASIPPAAPSSAPPARQSSPAEPATLRSAKAPNGKVLVSFQGNITKGDTDRINAIVERWRGQRSEVNALSIVSQGGDISEAIKLARYVRQNRLTTVVIDYQECTDQCVVVFSAGAEKWVGAGAKIGVPFLAEVWQAAVRRGSSESFRATLMKDYGLTREAIDRLIALPQDELSYLNAAELRSMGAVFMQAARKTAP